MSRNTRTFTSIAATTSIKFLNQPAQVKKKLGIIEGLLLPFNERNLRKIHQANLENQCEKIGPGKTGHTLIACGGAISVTEIQGQRPEQQDSASINRLKNFPTDIKEAKIQIQNQFDGANRFLEEQLPDASKLSGTTYERVILDTRDPDKVRVITIKAGDGDVYLVSENKGQLEVTQADYRDKPDHPDEKKRIEKLGGKVYIPKDPKWGPSRIRLDQHNPSDLSVSAGCGDFGCPYVRREPRISVREYPRQGKGQLEEILINCDGLTERYPDDKFIGQTLKEVRDLPAAAITEEFAFRAFDQGSTDNISVGAIKVKKILEMEPGVYEVLICDGHGPHGHIISKAVCEYHTDSLKLENNKQSTPEKEDEVIDKLSESKIYRNLSAPAKKAIKEYVEIIRVGSEKTSKNVLNPMLYKEIMGELQKENNPFTDAQRQRDISDSHWKMMGSISRKHESYESSVEQEIGGTKVEKITVAEIVGHLPKFDLLSPNRKAALQSLLDNVLTSPEISKLTLPAKVIVECLAKEIQRAFYTRCSKTDIAIGDSRTWVGFFCYKPHPVNQNNLIQAISNEAVSLGRALMIGS